MPNRTLTVNKTPRRTWLLRPLLLAGCLLPAGLMEMSAADHAAKPQAKASGFRLEEATIGEIHQAIMSGKLTSTDLVKQYLRRIKAYNGTSVNQPEGILGPVTPIAKAGQLNALSTLNLRPATRKALGFDDRKARSMTDTMDSNPAMPDALEIAAELDRQFATTGKLVGPLHGIVFSIKDQYDTFDMRTTAGADTFYANDRPPRDATFVKRLRDAGAIILAKANCGEGPSMRARSSFGGVFSNPFATDRYPGGSSGGSGASVNANLVTCSIAEETGASIRTPTRHNSLVGISPTQELVSRDGMINSGLNTRTGPICRNVEDLARVLDVIAGYDANDPMTAFSVGRMPPQPYPTYAREQSLKGMRIGIIREYMDKTLFSKADLESIDIVDRAIEKLRALGATIVDPGPGGSLFQAAINKYYPGLADELFIKRYPKLFPVDANGNPTADHVATLVAMELNPSLVPAGATLRNFGPARADGGSKYSHNVYLARRGDANIKTLTDMINKANFWKDPKFGDKKDDLVRSDQPLTVNTSGYLHQRFAIQTVVLHVMAELNLDALTYPTGNVPAPLLGAPFEPVLNNSPGGSSWNHLGQNGFPALSVPAGFTTQVYDRVPDPSSPDGTRLVGPVPAKLAVGIDFLGRPFSEPTLLRIASAYERATKHRIPPSDFGPLPAEQ